MDAIESVSMETCEKNSIKSELLETTGTHEESTKLLDSHAVKNNETEERAPPVDTDESNIMANHYNDLEYNSYVEGPGAQMPEQHQPGVLARKSNKSNREKCGIHLNYVPLDLNETGLRNLVRKYGEVMGVKLCRRPGNDRPVSCYAFVDYKSAEDAQNAIRNINDLQRTVDGKRKGMFASFKHDRTKQLDVDELPTLPQMPAVVTNPDEFNLPLSTPASLPASHTLLTEDDCDQLDVLRDFNNQPTNMLLENEELFEGISNGRANYRHSPETDDAMTKWQTVSPGSFDAKKQELVHNGMPDFCEIGNCKNCGASSLAFCKGCKDFFCSLTCFKEYIRTKSGCSCISPRKVELEAQIPNRHAVGRGGKLFSKSMSPTSSTYRRSVSSNDSDTEGTAVHACKKRIQKLQQSVDVTVEPCDVLLNNALVTITNVVSHKIVFLRSIEPKDDDRYWKYLNDVVESSKTAMPLDEKPKKSDIVLAKFEGAYYRALVARIENDVAVVAFLEFGNLERKPISELLKLREDLKYVKRFTFKANLSDVNGGLKTDKCLAYLYHLLERGSPLKFIKKGKVISSKGIRCELVVSTTNESVNAKLDNLNRIKPDKIVNEDDIPIKPLDVASTCTEVVVIDNTFIEKGLVTIVAKEHMTAFVLMHQRIQEYCKDEYESPYTPRPDETCLAKCNGQWYRVRTATSKGDMSPVMLFIDFQIYNKVHIDDMRAMPSEFRIPRYSLFAEIGGFTDATNMQELNEQLRLLSEVKVIKVEQDSPDEPKIFINFSKVAEKHVTTPKFKPRSQLLQMLNKNSSPDTKPL